MVVLAVMPTQAATVHTVFDWGSWTLMTSQNSSWLTKLFY